MVWNLLAGGNSDPARQQLVSCDLAELQQPFELDKGKLELFEEHYHFLN